MTAYSTPNSKNIPSIEANHRFFKCTFLPSTIMEWSIRYEHAFLFSSTILFRKRILEFIRPLPDNIFNAPNTKV